MAQGPEGSEILLAIAEARDKPQELGILLDLVKQLADSANVRTEADRIAVEPLRERLHHLLAEAQRSIEELLVRIDSGPLPGVEVEGVGEVAGDVVAVLPDHRASAAGAYLSTSAALHRSEALSSPPPSPERKGAVAEPHRYAAIARAVVAGQQAKIGELTTQVLEIQRGLSAL